MYLAALNLVSNVLNYVCSKIITNSQSGKTNLNLDNLSQDNFNLCKERKQYNIIPCFLQTRYIKCFLKPICVLCYVITEHSTCSSAIPAESGCNACVRIYCCYFEMKDNYVTLVTRPSTRLFQTIPVGALCSRRHAITLQCFIVALTRSLDYSGTSAGYKYCLLYTSRCV